jgi:hypothetical protein
MSDTQAFELAQDICAPVREMVVYSTGVPGYDKWVQAVKERLLRL